MVFFVYAKEKVKCTIKSVKIFYTLLVDLFGLFVNYYGKYDKFVNLLKMYFISKFDFVFERYSILLFKQIFKRIVI